jgi:hypothetical protein
MTSQPLSPAAHAVEDAYFNADGFGYRNGLAAALRAAADQVVPQLQGEPTTWTQCAFLGVREDLLAIAAELDNSAKQS